MRWPMTVLPQNGKNVSLGACIVLLIFSGLYGQRTSTNMYLLNLAVSDFIVCGVGQLCRHLPRNVSGFDITGQYEIICQLWFFIVFSK